MDDKSLHIVFEIQNPLIASQYTKSLHPYTYLHNKVKEIIMTASL